MNAKLSIITCPGCGHQISYDPVIDISANPRSIETMPDNWDDWLCERCHVLVRHAKDVVFWTDSGAALVLADSSRRNGMSPRALFKYCAELLFGTVLRRGTPSSKARLFPTLPSFLTALRVPCTLYGRPLLSMEGDWAEGRELLDSLADDLLKAALPELAYEMFDSVLKDFPALALEDGFYEAVELCALACEDKRSPVNPSQYSAEWRLRDLATRIQRHLGASVPLGELSIDVVTVIPPGSSVALALNAERVRTPEIEIAKLHFKGLMWAGRCRRYLEGSHPAPGATSDLKFFNEGSIICIEHIWAKLSSVGRMELDYYGIGMSGQRVSDTLHLQKECGDGGGQTSVDDSPGSAPSREQFDAGKRLGTHATGTLAKLYERAVTLERRGERQAALDLIDAVLAREPWHEGARNMAADLLIMNSNRILDADHDPNRYKSAVECTSRAIRLRPTWLPALNIHSVCLIRLGHLEEALVVCDKMIDISPEWAISWIRRGLCLKFMLRFDEARICYETALRLKPDTWSDGVNTMEAAQYLLTELTSTSHVGRR